jgi:hypothetical protein
MGTLNVPVDDGDVEEVKVAELVERELGQRVWRAPVPRAPQHAATVADPAASAAAPVEPAARASPDARGCCAGGHV